MFGLWIANIYSKALRTQRVFQKLNDKSSRSAIKTLSVPIAEHKTELSVAKDAEKSHACGI